MIQGYGYFGGVLAWERISMRWIPSHLYREYFARIHRNETCLQCSQRLCLVGDGLAWNSGGIPILVSPVPGPTCSKKGAQRHP